MKTGTDSKDPALILVKYFATLEQSEAKSRAAEALRALLEQTERETLERAAELCAELQDVQNNPYFNNGVIQAVMRIRSLQTIRDTQAELQCRDNNHAWAYGNSACFCGKETW